MFKGNFCSLRVSKFNSCRAVNLIESEANGKESTESQISEVTQKKETLDSQTINNSNPSVEPFDSNQMTYSAIKVSSKEKKTLERKIEIPLNLVGLLLSRKPQLKVRFEMKDLLIFLIVCRFPS